MPESPPQHVADSQPTKAVSVSELFSQADSLAVQPSQNHAASVPRPLSQTDQSCISPRAVQESQNAEDRSPSSPSLRERQMFGKKEIASLAPVPRVGEHYVYSKSNYFSESTQSFNHPTKENKEVFQYSKSYMPKAVQLVLEHYNAAALEEPTKRNAALHHPVHPSLLPSVVVKLEVGHIVRERELPTAEGCTHDFKVYVRGAAGFAIEHFISTVVFRLPLFYRRPIRARREPPFEINVPGYAAITVEIYMYFRTKEKSIKVTYSYDINLRSGDEVRRRKLIFQNPGPDFRKKLLLSGGVPCMTVYARSDSPREASSSAFIPNELTTSPIQSQESNSVTADANQSTVEDGILTIVYDGSFPSATVKSPCDSDLTKGWPDSGHIKDMLDFYLKVFKKRSSQQNWKQYLSSTAYFLYP